MARPSPVAAVALSRHLVFLGVVSWSLVAYLDVAFDTEPAREVKVRYVRYAQRTEGGSYDVVTSWDDPEATVEDIVALRHEVSRLRHDFDTARNAPAWTRSSSAWPRSSRASA